MGYIPPNEKTFGHVLKSAGYQTGLAGKWQMTLLKNDPNHIQKMGFDNSCVFGWHEGPRYHKPYIWQNGKIRNDVDNRYGPDVYSEFLIDFITKNKNQPFLAYYPMTLAHEISNDLEIPPPTSPNGKYQSYKELVEYMDVLVGRLVKTLEELGIREKTLILFTTDNGTPKKFITEFEDGQYIKEPILSYMGDKISIGGKSELTDAGTHVPLIANWPGTTPSGLVLDDLIDFSDFLPTLAELSNANIPARVIIDGQSFAKQIKGKKGQPREWVYTQWEGEAWLRTKLWKLYRNGLLYNMQNDPNEKFPITSDNDSEDSRTVRKRLEAVFENLYHTKS